MLVHRIIKKSLHGELDKKELKRLKGAVEYAAKVSSDAERKAIEAEREAEKLKMAEYMSYHIGERFTGVISGVTSFGIYVRLENTVEGLVRIDSLYDDYYDLIEEKYMLTGRHTNRTYKLGDEMEIIVDDVNTDRNEIDFLICSCPRNS